LTNEKLQVHDSSVFAFLSSDGFAAPQDPLPGHMDQFEEQTPTQQSFEPAGLSQGQCRFQ
jgi:hypothetical protein